MHTYIHTYIHTHIHTYIQVETREGSRLRDGALFMYMGNIVKGLDVESLAAQPQLVWPL